MATRGRPSARKACRAWYSGHLTGWGVTGVATTTRQTLSNDNKPQVPAQMLQLARLQFWQPDYCIRAPRFARKGYKIRPGQICAGSLGNEFACFLDSGGPLVRYPAAPRNAARGGGGAAAVAPMLVGLVSFGVGCGNTASPSGFVDVRFFEGSIKRAKGRYRPGRVVRIR